MATITSNTAGEWSTGSMWIGGVSPGAGDIAVINHAITLSVNNVTCAGLTINAGKSLTSSNAKSLTLANGGTLANNGTLSLGTGGVIFGTGCTICIGNGCSFVNPHVLLVNSDTTITLSITAISYTVSVTNVGAFRFYYPSDEPKQIAAVNIGEIPNGTLLNLVSVSPGYVQNGVLKLGNVPYILATLNNQLAFGKSFTIYLDNSNGIISWACTLSGFAVGDMLTLCFNSYSGKNAVGAVPLRWSVSSYTVKIVDQYKKMDLCNAPNATAITAIQNGLAKTSDLMTDAEFDAAIAQLALESSITTVGAGVTALGSPMQAGATVDANVTRINGNLVNDDNNGGLLPPYFDSLLTRTGSTRTVINVKGTNQNAAWGENVLKGSTIYYKEQNGLSPRYFPGVILSNTAINSTSGTITLAGEGFPAAPENANEQLALIVNSHASVLDVKAKTDAIPASPAAVGSAMTLQSAEREAIAIALLDLANTIDGKTLRQALRIISAILAGKVTGAGTGTECFRSLDDQHNRVVVAADVNGNRTNVEYRD